MAQHQAPQPQLPCLTWGPEAPASSGLPAVQWVLWTWRDWCLRGGEEAVQALSRCPHPSQQRRLLDPQPTRTVLPSGLDLVLGSPAPESAILGAPGPGEEDVLPGTLLSSPQTRLMGADTAGKELGAPENPCEAASAGAVPRGVR